jgi:hypothetical protein
LSWSRVQKPAQDRFRIDPSQVKNRFKNRVKNSSKAEIQGRFSAGQEEVQAPEAGARIR